jgi:hypothetical protein
VSIDDEMEAHGDDVVNQLTHYLIDSYLDSTNHLLEVLQANPRQDLDLISHLKITKRRLHRHLERQFS